MYHNMGAPQETEIYVRYQNDGDADKFLQAVCAAGYATGPAFKVELAIEHQQNILHAVDMARSERSQE